MSKGTYSFTTPIYYVNAEPHLGTAYTTVAADTVARYQRMNGYDVAFVTGMDEHGQKVADTAESKGMTPQAWCDSMEPAFRNVWDLLDITYTDFVRTTQPRHTRTVQKFWQDLFDKGWCYKGSYEGWYCVHEETYYAESDLEKNEDGELVCPDCHRPVQKAGGEENWFFKLSEFQEPLLKFYEENPDFIRPETRKNEVVTFVKSGLKDLSISRSTFDWGVPLPFDEGHVAYVWADALLAYLTGIGYGDEQRAGEFEQRWPMQYHFVGKDITRFHCVIWPAMLMAAGLPITHTVFGHGFLLTKGEKMSKSKGNGIAPQEVIDKYGADVLRLWVASTDYSVDVSIGDNILQRTSDAYRRFRNTFRFLLGNLDGFDFKRDAVSLDEMRPVDVWAMLRLKQLLDDVERGYNEYHFHQVFRALYDYVVGDLSSVYMDVVKDRLYAEAPGSVARRSAQTVLMNILEVLVRVMSPILSFTCDEVWEHYPETERNREGRPVSVQLAGWPEAADFIPALPQGEAAETVMANFACLLEVRDAVTKAIEEARNAKTVGKSQEAVLKITVSQAVADVLGAYDAADLEELFIVSHVDVVAGDVEEAQVEVSATSEPKCPRCWNHRELGGNANHAEVCKRCGDVLDQLA